jgi:hypothetical protein
MQNILWNRHPEKMIKATEMMILMCKKYDIPFNYKDLGIIQDDIEEENEDSLWGFVGRG